MGTRARIAIAEPNSRYRSIYTHWDGYPEHHGPILLEHWTNPEKVNRLMTIGDLSSFAEEIGRKHDFDWMMKRNKMKPARIATLKKQCNSYARDRGETDCSAIQSDSFSDLARLADKCGAEYLYVLYDEKWLFSPVSDSMTFDSLILLTPAAWQTETTIQPQER